MLKPGILGRDVRKTEGASDCRVIFLSVAQNRFGLAFVVINIFYFFS